MIKKLLFLLVFAFFIALISAPSSGWENSYPLIIGHLCSDLTAVPSEWIDSVKVNIKFHYAHTSHGNQLTTGLSYIELDDDFYSVAIQDMNLPQEPGAFCIFNGQEDDTYITPEEYWQTESGMNKTRNVQDNNPQINTSAWAWCCQLESYTEEDTQAYLDSIAGLEAEYPNSTFIYMTGNAQEEYASGFNRYLRNEQIRQYCIDNNKVLFDFADLDSWWFNPDTEEWEQATYQYNGYEVPVEHPQFEGNDSGHTTLESCKQKGRAVWWMMAVIAGWTGGICEADKGLTTPAVLTLKQNYPNPFNATTAIEYEIYRACRVELAVYDMSGRLVKKLFQGKLKRNQYREVWNGKNQYGKAVASGMYLYRLKGLGGMNITRKMLLLR